MASNMSNEELLATLQFVDDAEKQYFAEAQLGLQVRDFLASPAGRYLHGRAKAELDAVGEEMLELSPYSLFGKRKWMALKIRQGVAQRFMSWCADALTEGIQAERKLEEYRD